MCVKAKNCKEIKFSDETAETPIQNNMDVNNYQSGIEYKTTLA